jgi:hypothetical protein
LGKLGVFIKFANKSPRKAKISITIIIATNMNTLHDPDAFALLSS